MKCVYICSPYRPNDVHTTEAHVAYLRLCLADSLSKDEAPLAPHGYLPMALNDNVLTDRLTGMLAGLAWGKNADLVACYCDMGISDGMTDEITEFKRLGIPVERRVVDDIESVMAIKNG